MFAVPSLHWARVHWKGKPDPHGPDAGQWLCWLNHVGQPVARRDAPHPRDTTIERLSGWIRTTGGQPVTQGPRQPLPESSSRAEGDSDGSHSDAVPLAWPARAGTKRYEWTSRRDKPPVTPGTAGYPPSFGTSDRPVGPCNPHGPRVGKYYKTSNW